MEQILSNIIKHIDEGMPQLSFVDEDYGQLEALSDNTKDTYPLTFPAVLIENTQTSWSNITGNSQKGDASLQVRLIIDCYDDTHAGSGTRAAVFGREELRSRLHTLLQGYRPMDDGVLVRTGSKFYTWIHGIKVYESTYSLTMTETIQETVPVGRPSVRLSVGERLP